ncbi:hypothetical protein D8674_024919 [Pyrus ussuriensis x Pyrus communis]|uniref:Retrotransposon gag domain-containing protein n=1 Tax=Pyrus ussuriensis x Pyrus communis TaxID=2448454 RepID=A0A5N5H6X8_9ROSA|nr:hypothetical protein D8674_024919 [Pyrus ussuriensis x Pyrus communis]
MKRKLNDQRVPENLKVTIACTYLEEQAYYWWESMLVNPDLQITTWTTFEVIFLEKYFLEPMRVMRTREFSNLCQNEMIVAQYMSKFKELMRFAPYMIPDEITKATKLEEELRAEIKEKVELFKLKRYAEIVDRALMAKQIILGSKRALEDKKPGAGQNSKRPRSPWGSCVKVNQVCRSSTIDILHHKLDCDLLLLDLLDYDVIFGMDLLKRFEAIIDCGKKLITLTTLNGEKFSFYGDTKVSKPNSILDKRKVNYLSQIGHMIAKGISESKIEYILLVRDFIDVFPEDLPGLPLIREIEFSIETYPGTSPISIPPYRVAPVELKELNKQFQELQEKVENPKDLWLICIIKSQR